MKWVSDCYGWKKAGLCLLPLAWVPPGIKCSFPAQFHYLWTFSLATPRHMYSSAISPAIFHSLSMSAVRFMLLTSKLAMSFIEFMLCSVFLLWKLFTRVDCPLQNTHEIILAVSMWTSWGAMICLLVIMMKGLYWFVLHLCCSFCVALYAGKERTKRNDWNESSGVFN